MLDFLLVIPTLNEERYIAEIIESSDRLLSSMFKNYKIVVVDESSKDNTVEIIKAMTSSYKFNSFNFLFMKFRILVQLSHSF